MKEVPRSSCLKTDMAVPFGEEYEKRHVAPHPRRVRFDDDGRQAPIVTSCSTGSVSESNSDLYVLENMLIHSVFTDPRTTECSFEPLIGQC